jgi:radical SAM protein with 4Fe4S-binding SPASM domain
MTAPKQHMMVYLKTTETCNLNCDHCFTSGKFGRKIYFDVDRTIDWFARLSDSMSNKPDLHIEFHGGEPFLAPLEDMQRAYDEISKHWPNASWGITTNLVHKLTPEKLEFIDTVLGKRIGTSWDPKIRFDNINQRILFEENIKLLLGRGVTIKLFVSLTKDVVNMEPIELLMYVKGLGVQEMDIERVTKNGHATRNLHIFPTNKEMDDWFLKMHHQMEEYDARDWFHNNFMENIYTKFETGQTKAGTWCRDCEQKLFTINADGTIAGCPNSAPEDHYGTIDMPIYDLLFAPKRIEIMACEAAGNSLCLECPVYKYCGGDCHQLEWDGTICASPRSLMIHLDKERGRIDGYINRSSKKTEYS